MSAGAHVCKRASKVIYMSNFTRYDTKWFCQRSCNNVEMEIGLVFALLPVYTGRLHQAASFLVGGARVIEGYTMKFKHE